MHGFQTLLIDMRINLGRGNIGMTEHFLNDAQIGAIAEQVRGKTVPKQMRIDIFFQARLSGNSFYDLPDARCS